MSPMLTDKFGVPVQDLIVNAALERLEGITTLNITGHASDVNDDEMLLWEPQTQYIYPTSAQVNSIGIASVNAGDNATSGEGAYTVKIDGLDTDYDRITETVSLTGITPINLSENFLRINNISVQTAGESLTNLGSD